MHRRGLLRGGIAVGSAVLLGDTVNRPTPEGIAAQAARTNVLRTQLTRASTPVAVRLDRHADRLAATFDGVTGAREVIVGTAAIDAACLASRALLDAGRPGRAVTLASTAVDLARVLRDRDLYAVATARLGQALVGCGRADVAAAVLERVRPRRLSPHAALFHLVHTAEVRAKSGAAYEALAALDRAEVELDRLDAVDRPPWAAHFGPSYLAHSRATVYGRLRRVEHAEEALYEAMAGLRPGDHRAEGALVLGLAEAAVRRRAVDEASHHAIRGVVIASRAGATRYVDRARAVRRELEPWAPSAHVRALDAALAAAAR